MSLLNKTHVAVDSNDDALASFSSWGFVLRSFRSSLSQLKLTVWVLFGFIPSSPLLHLSCFDFCTLQCVGLSNECKLKQSIDQSFKRHLVHACCTLHRLWYFLCHLHTFSSQLWSWDEDVCFCGKTLGGLVSQWTCWLACLMILKLNKKQLLKACFCGSCCECNSLKSGLLGASTNHLATIGPFHNEHVQTRMTLHFFGCMCLQLLQLSGFVTAEPGEEWGPCGGWRRGLRVHWWGLFFSERRLWAATPRTFQAVGQCPCSSPL